MIWHNAQIDKVLSELTVEADKGLHTGVADDRIAIFGKNTISNDEKEKYYKHFLKALNSKFNYFLLLIAVLLLIFKIIYKESTYFAPIFVLAVVIINSLFSAYHKFRSMRAFNSLTSNINPSVNVIRDGIAKQIPSDYLVPGDILILKSGDYITADARIIECTDFSTNEIALTGETFPIEKHYDMVFDDITPIKNRANMVYAGSSVATGSAKVVVVETGLNTEIGKTKEILEQTGSEKLPINDSLEKIGKVVNLIIVLACVVIFVISVLRNLNNYGNFTALTITMITNSIALAVAAIPESLPAVSIIVVALGLERILKDRVIIKRIRVLETLGKTNVICADKTGILTRNIMHLNSIYDGETIYKPTPGNISEKNALALKLAALCSTLNNDSTEESIAAACEELCSAKREEIENIYPRLGVIPFDTTRKAMTTINMISGSPLAIVKGAPEYVIDKCIDCNKEEIIKTQKQMAEDGLRVLCIAIKNLSEAPANPTAEEVEKDLTFVCLLGLDDPPRAGAVEGIKVCNEAGIRAIMITGDNLATATAVARQIGVLDENHLAISGEELENMSDDELYENIEKYSVYARITPADKLRIIGAWQRKGMIVTVTGDNTEDADALNQADIGCVMGKSSTDVARGNADIVIEENNFKYLIKAIKESRGMFDNIKKSVCYILGCNIAELIVYLICVLAVGLPPLAAVQLLLLNLFSDSAPTIALATEKPDNDIMKRQPITLNGRLFDFTSIVQTFSYSLFLSIISIASFFIGYSTSPECAVTMTFATLSIAQILHTFNMKSNDSVLKIDFKSNKFMNYSSVILIFLSMFLVLTPAGFVFNLTILSSGKFFLALLLAVLIIPFGELIKHFFKKAEA